MSSTQLTFFEPTGIEVLHLAETHERVCVKLRRLHDTLNLKGWENASFPVLRALCDAERRVAECYMLAEFEALGGVHD